MNNSKPQVQAPRPNTDLDFQQSLTDPYISSQYINPSFSDKFKEYDYLRDENGEPILNEKGNYSVVVKRDLWAVLQMFTRDWRLGNIDTKREAVYIRHYLDLTTDIITILGDDFREVAIICFERALVVNETSQSKGGFLRKMLNTFIHKTTPNASDDGKNKRNLLGLGKKTN